MQQAATFSSLHYQLSLEEDRHYPDFAVCHEFPCFAPTFVSTIL